MTWRDDYRPGSFRGIPFNLQRSMRSGGRRTVLDEYPLRDEPSTQDLGRTARQFNLDMVLIGAEYMEARDNLIAALEQYGPGTLIHPFYGEMNVAVLGTYSCEESTEQGGKATISATFVETTAKPHPESNLVPGATVNAAADAIEADAVAEFEDKFSVVGFASSVVDSASEMVAKATSAINEIGSRLSGAGEFASKIQRPAGDIQNLILLPGNLALNLVETIKSMTRFGNPFAALMAQMSLFGFGSTAKRQKGTGYVSPARAQVAANQEAVYTLIERIAVAEAARLATGRPQDEKGQAFPGVEFESRDDAADVRDKILDELDRQATVAERLSYPLLSKLSAELVRDMNTRAASLAPLARITPLTTQPALLIAHRLYGDARRADEIVLRNRIKHPGFVAGGVALEVLKDA